MIKSSVIMNPTTVCLNFPRLQHPLIERTDILNTIDNMIFPRASNIVIFEGEEGVGKTTLLAQYAMKHAEHTISLFTNERDFDLDFLRHDMCNQLEWIISRQELDPSTLVDDGYWRNKLVELKRRARWDNFYFVIDGLDEIPEENMQLREQILDLFSFEQRNFYFVISGDPKKLFLGRRTRLNYKTQYLLPFSLAETKAYFADFNF